MAAVLSLAVVACSGSSDSKTEAEVPDGWKKFEDSGYSGHIDPDWTYAVLPQDEFVALAEEGLTMSRLADAAEFFQDLDEDDLSDTVLVVLMGEGFPNINIQRCAPGLRSKSITALSDAYEDAGLPVEDAGTVTYNGESSDVLMVSMFEGIETYQALIGSSGCYSVVTLTALPEDEAALDSWRDFMANLEIAAN